MLYLHKGLVNKSVKNLTESDIQLLLKDGWKEGKCPSHWITDGINNKLLKEGLSLPEGYYFGQSESFRKKNSIGNKRRWKNMSEEDKKRISEKVSIGTSKMWSNLTIEQKELREKHRMDTRLLWTEDEKKMFHDKMSNSAILNRKTITPEEYHRRSILGSKSKKQRGTFAVSSVEEECYKRLCESYGSDDIISEYSSDERYPFSCDFYIKSLDLFIELNIHPSHNTHPFDSNNKEDVKLLEKLTSDNTAWSKMIIDVWCNRDPKKVKHALDNNLNYLSIYKCNLVDFYTKIKEKRL